MNTNSDVLREANNMLATGSNENELLNFFSENYVAHITGRTLSGGHRIVKGFTTEITAAFSDIKITFDVLMDDGSKVAWRRTWTAVQTGKYKGFPASNKKLMWTDMVVTRFENGLITEDWLLTDLAEQLLKSRK